MAYIYIVSWITRRLILISIKVLDKDKRHLNIHQGFFITINYSVSCFLTDRNYGVSLNTLVLTS